MILSALPSAESDANIAVANTIALNTVTNASGMPSSPAAFHAHDENIAAGTAQQTMVRTESKVVFIDEERWV